MPRRRRATRICDPGTRKVAGSLCFAAAAEAEGQLYGSTSLERKLGFTPGARASRRALVSQDPSASPRHVPTGTCKKWLHGHVVSDQTISLIAESHPQTADRIRAARDGGLVKALTIGESDYRYVGRQMRALSKSMFGAHLGCIAFGHCNPAFASGVAAELLCRSLRGGGLKELIALISLDRQMPYPRSHTTDRCLQEAFHLTLSNAAQIHPEVAFAQAALAEVWRRRHPDPISVDLPLNRSDKSRSILDFPRLKCSWPNHAYFES